MERLQEVNSKKANLTPPAESLVAEVACDYVTVELAGGYRGQARLFEARDAERAVVYLHGIQSHGGWFLRSCDHLRRQGMTVLAPDRRGSGLNQTDRGHCDNPEQLLNDVDACVNWLADHTGSKQVDLVAVSWSGKLALAYAARHVDKVRSLALVTPGLCAKVDISLREKIAVGVQGLVQPHKQHEIPLNDPQLFTANPAMRRFIEQDPLKLTHATASFLVTSSRLDAAVRKTIWKVRAPVYLFLAELDRIIDNQATVKLLRPALRPIRQAPEPHATITCNSTDEDAFPGPAALYWAAHHTLDFESDPQGFLADLCTALMNDPPASSLG